MLNNWEAVAALTGVVAALVAIVALMIEVRLSRKAAQIELARHFDETFRSVEFITIRARASQLLLSGIPDSRQTVLDQLFGLFEFLGLLYRERALSDFVIWHLFATHIRHYVGAAKSYVEALNHQNPSVYQELLRLHKVLQRVERREGGANSPDLDPTPDAIRHFLKSEIRAALDDPLTPLFRRTTPHASGAA